MHMKEDTENVKEDKLCVLLYVGTMQLCMGVE